MAEYSARHGMGRGVLEILEGELMFAMGICGTRTVADIHRAYIAAPDWKN